MTTDSRTDKRIKAARMGIAALFILALSFLFTLGARADGPLPAMQALFEKYPEFPCVGALELAPQLPVLNRFADARGLDRAAVNCYHFVRIFDRDLRLREKGERALTRYDYAALHYRDINALINELGGMDAYRINDDTDRPRHGSWVRWLNRFELGE